MSGRVAPRGEDKVFKALADPTRRELLDELRGGALTTGELCARHPEMTRFGVMAHLNVLTDAGLVIATRRGRQRFNHLNPVPIAQIYERWIRPYAKAPAAELIALAKAVEGGTKRRTRPEEGS
ncbi:MAG TPA: metalloregulator ArsR/SmtB family transcription factor [Actinomycetota bacterium]